MGVYVKGVRAYTVEVDGVVIATSSFAGRAPTYRDYDNPKFARSWEAKCERLGQVAKKHVANGVKYVMEGTKKSLSIPKHLVEQGMTEQRIPVIKMREFGDIIETAFDNRRVGVVVVEAGKKPRFEMNDE